MKVWKDIKNLTQLGGPHHAGCQDTWLKSSTGPGARHAEVREKSRGQRESPGGRGRNGSS